MLARYHQKIIRLLLRDPFKTPTLFSLKQTRNNNWQKDFSDPKRRVRIAPPRVVAVRPNYACNLRCVMCNQWGEEGVFVKTPERITRREMTTDDWKRFFDDIASFRPYIYFTGGEPLMNKDIIELIRHASSRHMVTSMSTNSTYLTEKAEDLIRAGLDYLYTSLDSPVPALSDAVRKTVKNEDSQAASARAIRDFIRLKEKIGSGLPIVQTQTIIVRENQYQIYDMARFVQDELGSDVWGLQLCVFTTPELNSQTTAVYKQDFGQDQVGWAGFIRNMTGMDCDAIEEQLKKIQNQKWNFRFRPYKPLGMRGFNLKTYFDRPDQNTSAEDLTCLNPYVFAQIQPNGDVAFCGSQPDYVIGNVRQNRLLDLWTNERANRWRDLLQKRLFASCKRCFSLHEFSHFKG